MRNSPRPCALRNNGLASSWMNGRPVPDTPLVRYINGSFEPVEVVGPYEFMLPPRPKPKPKPKPKPAGKG
jgi:hypothetical protein